VKQYQQSMGLTVDGIVGGQTWGALSSGGASGYTAISYDSGGGASGSPYDALTGDGWSDGGSGGDYGAPTSYADPGASGGYPYMSGGTGSSSGGTEQWHEYSFDQMMSELDMTRYQQKDASALEAEARGLYDPVYNAEREGLTHQAEQNALMLEQELAGLGDSYDRAREDTAKSFDDAYSQAGNAMLSRGMQRSSYGQQIQSNIQIAGGKAQQDLNTAQAKDEGNIRATASMYDRQFNESLTRLAADYEQNVTNMRLQLEQREYDRYWQSQQAMNNLNLAIYQASLTTKQYEESIRQFNAQLAENQRQFNLSLAENARQFDMSYSLQAQQLAAQQAAAAKASSGGSSSSGSSSKSTTASSSSKAPTVSNSNSISEYDMIDYQRMLSQMNSSSSAAKTTTSGGHAGGNLVM
jgi:hypothetical protein